MTTETPIEADARLDQDAPAERSDAPDPQYGAAHLAAATGSVKALIADLRYIMAKAEAVRWPSLASAALEHHSPSVPDDQLSYDMRELQTYGRAALSGICQSDFDAIRDAIIELRAAEARLDEG